MSAGKFLGTGPFDLSPVCGIPWAHLFSADYAGILLAEIFGGSIRILIHIFECLAITQKRTKSFEKGSCGHEPVTNYVNGKTVKCKENAKEGRIETQLYEICKGGVLVPQRFRFKKGLG